MGTIFRNIARSILYTVFPRRIATFMGWHRHQFGAAATLVRLFDPRVWRGRPIGVRNTSIDAVVYVRPGSSDQYVFNQVFLNKEYDLDIGQPAFIVDAGANIGLATVLFAYRFPNATIVALEPDGDNYRVLKENTKRFPNVVAVQKALWSHRTNLRVENPEAENWEFRVIEDDNGHIPAVGIGDVMRECGALFIDLLKLDIEGAEVEVMRSADQWIDSVGVIVAETHDRFRPGSSRAVDDAVRGRDVETQQYGENVVLRIRARDVK